MNQNNSEDNEYIEAEVIESQALSSSEDSCQNYEQPYQPPKSNNKGCYLIMGCLFIFLVGLITVIGSLLNLFTDILSSLF
ncbi:MAG: hypothetical protein ACK5MD_08955 [Flavobacteriales bacterium]